MSGIYILHIPHSVKLWWRQTLVNLTNYHSITKYNPQFLNLIIAGDMPGETMTLNYFQCAFDTWKGTIPVLTFIIQMGFYVSSPASEQKSYFAAGNQCRGKRAICHLSHDALIAKVKEVCTCICQGDTHFNPPNFLWS